MIAVSLINGLISVHLDYQKNRLALSIRSALISAVYQKATLVSHSTFAGISIGEILNMMSTDCERVSGIEGWKFQFFKIGLKYNYFYSAGKIL